MEIAIGRLAQIPRGEGRTFALDAPDAPPFIAVFHTRDGRVFASQAQCPHLGGPLADGLTDSDTVVCPLHDRAFDFRTGEGIGNDCRIAIYPARTCEDGTILVAV